MISSPHKTVTIIVIEPKEELSYVINREKSRRVSSKGLSK